jgi:hypothetical protein
MRPLPTGFIPPALPTRAKEPPRGSDWWHEIKHDGIRIIARKTDKGIRLYSRPGNDLTRRFPLIVEALAGLSVRTCILDGEAVSCGDDGIALFELVRHWRNGEAAFLFAFDLIELNGDDLRPQPLERRKTILARLLSRSTSGIQLNEHMEHDDGALVFEQACRLGLEGIVSKRRGSPYRSGRTPDAQPGRPSSCTSTIDNVLAVIGEHQADPMCRGSGHEDVIPQRSKPRLRFDVTMPDLDGWSALDARCLCLPGRRTWIVPRLEEGLRRREFWGRIAWLLGTRLMQRCRYAARCMRPVLQSDARNDMVTWRPIEVDWSNQLGGGSICRRTSEFRGEPL